MVEFTHEQLKLMYSQSQAKLALAVKALKEAGRYASSQDTTIKALVQPVQVFLGEHGQVRDGERMPLGSQLLVALRSCVHNAVRDVSRETVPKVQVTSEGPMPPETEATAP